MISKYLSYCLKYFINLIIFLSPITVWSQEPSIFGISFWSSYEYAKDKLDKRFKREIVPNYETKETLLYHDVSVGDIPFSSLMLWFQVGHNGSFLTSADLSQSFISKNEALKFRDRIKTLYSKKYKYIIQFTNGAGFIGYKFGNENDQIIGFIIISPMDLPSGKRYMVDIMYKPESIAIDDI